jgi:Na+/melibiose symporter-like transporter
VGGACCFLPFPKAPVWAKFIIFIAGYVIWDAFYTIANVPYGSLLSIISKEPADRASLSAWRSVGSMVGNMVPMIILPFIIYNKDESLNGPRVFLAALIMGALGFICFQFMIKNTEIRVDTDVTVSEEREKFNVFKAMGNFIKNRPAVGATLAAIAILTKHELSLALIGGIFVVEALSSIIQITAIKKFKKRVFLMAPIHHHFEKLGFEETDIVKGFYIIAMLLGTIAIYYGVWM